MIKTYSFGDLAKVDYFLNGGISGGKKVVNANGKIMGLHDLTLVFNLPASATVTFVDATGMGLTPAEIIAQVVAVVATVQPSFQDGYMNLIESAVSGGVNLDATGTANSAFGFGNTDTVGTVYAPWDGTAPRLLDGPYAKAQQGGYYIVVEET